MPAITFANNNNNNGLETLSLSLSLSLFLALSWCATMITAYARIRIFQKIDLDDGGKRFGTRDSGSDNSELSMITWMNVLCREIDPSTGSWDIGFDWSYAKFCERHWHRVIYHVSYYVSSYHVSHIISLFPFQMLRGELRGSVIYKFNPISLIQSMLSILVTV